MRTGNPYPRTPEDSEIYRILPWKGYGYHVKYYYPGTEVAPEGSRAHGKWLSR